MYYKLQKYKDMAHGTPRGQLCLAIVKKHWSEWERKVVSPSRYDALGAEDILNSGQGPAVGIFLDAVWRFGYLEELPGKVEAGLFWKLECWLEDILYMEAVSYYNNGTGCKVGVTMAEMFRSGGEGCYEDVEWSEA